MVRCGTRAALILSLCVAFSGCSCGDPPELTALTIELAADTEALAFADAYVGGTGTETVTLASTGTGPVDLDAPLIDGADAFTVTNAPDGLVSDARTTLTVEFRPTSEGPFTATLVLGSDDPDGTLTIALAGVGLAPLACDDDNACTDESFDPEAGACIRANRDGACDDGSACTADDRCLAGVCAGDAIACADSVTCTRDVCDPAIGCVFLPDDSVCADEDPCSLDRCTPGAFGNGCTHGPAPDGTPCGDYVECGTIELCVSQLCIDIEIPDGAPCADGDACTLGDACTAGACVGSPTTNPAAVVSESFRFDGANSVLLGDHLVIADRSIHVLSVDTLLPVGHLDGVAFSTPPSPIARPNAASVALIHENDTVIVVDVTDALSPTLVGQTDFEDRARFAGVTEASLFVCVGFELLAVSWDDATAVPVEDQGLCDAQDARALGPFALRSDDEIATVFTAFDFDENGAHERGSILFPAFESGGRSPRMSVDQSRVAMLRRDFNEEQADLHIVELANPSAPVVVNVPIPVAFGRVTNVLLHRPWLYLFGENAVHRLDVEEPEAPAVDDWRIDAAFAAGHANDQRVVGLSLPSGTFHVASTVGSGAQSTDAMVFGQGNIAALFASAPEVVAVEQRSIIVFTDATAGAPVPRVAQGDDARRTRLIETELGTRGFFAEPFWSGVGQFSRPATVPRGDVRESIRSGDPADEGYPWDVLLSIAGGIGNATPVTLELQSDANELRAIALEGCRGVGVTSCFDGCATPQQLVTLSACEAGVDLASTGIVTLSTTDPAAILSSTHHGSHVTVLAESSAVLVELATSSVIDVPIAELEGAIFVSAAFADGAWLVLATYGDGTRPARAIVFDTSSGGAVRTAAFDVGSVGVASIVPEDVVRRALGIVDGRAYLSDWDPLQAVEYGHSVVIYDLTTDPPLLVDALALASEPVDMEVREVGLLVARPDGLSVVSPACGP